MNQNNFLKKLLVYCMLLLFFEACKVPYYPPVKSTDAHFLVVEGYINVNGMTNIKLTRTIIISPGDTARYINETGARMTIEDNMNNQFPLTETNGGNYAGNYSLNIFNQYRIHIFTKDQKEYVSDFVNCKEAPSIDTVYWRFKDGDVQILLNTHDPNNQTKFYRWNYSETWEFHSEYFSKLIFNSPDYTFSPRVVPVNVCYRTDYSTKILTASSAKLSDDVINEAQIAVIPKHDRKISVLYSILVTQFALDSSGYNYWNAIKANTEEIGSIFDAQPNQTPGNVHNIKDVSEKVIGYIGAGSVAQRRLFISNSSMPSGWNEPRNCTYYDVPPDSIGYYYASGAFVPVIYDSIRRNINGIDSTIILGIYGGSATCTDCTLTGTLDKPAFWP
jgi:hypothetical protein